MPSIKEDSIEKRSFIRNAYLEIAKAKQFIRNGSIITRTGNDFTSQSLRSLNQRNKTYSHCGIASIENDSIFVYHALGGEFNPDQKLLRESFENFAEPYSNNGIGIYHFEEKLLDPASLVKTAKQLHKKETKFDMDFDLNTEDRMYCAEFVAHCIQYASAQKLRIPHSMIRGFEFIGVDDIFLHPASEFIHGASYK